VAATLGALDGARVLDLYAGSGAVGLEALSRGASRALLVEADPRAAEVIRANIAALGLRGARVVVERADRVLARGPATVSAGGPAVMPAGAAEQHYDFVFADPPYATADGEVTAMLTALADGGWLAPGALVAVERATRSGQQHWPAGYSPDRSRRYGEATLWYGLAAGPRPARSA